MKDHDAFVAYHTALSSEERSTVRAVAHCAPDSLTVAPSGTAAGTDLVRSLAGPLASAGWVTYKQGRPDGPGVLELVSGTKLRRLAKYELLAP